MISQPKQLGAQANQGQEMGTQGKGGEKRGRKSLNESIQMVGELLVNSRRVVPLSEVFHQLIKLLK